MVNMTKFQKKYYFEITHCVNNTSYIQETIFQKFYGLFEFFRKKYFGYNKINYLISDFSFAKTFKQRIGFSEYQQ